MIQLKLMLEAGWIEAIEGYCFENPDSRWSLVQGEPGEPLFLCGFFDSEPEAQSAFQLMEAESGLANLPEPVVETLEDKDWKEAYKYHLKPWVCGPLLWLPVWEVDHPDYSGEAYRRVLLDSGMAFGTGSHETTQLCAKALVMIYESTTDLETQQVIDAGCGSGVLALSAAVLGFGKVSGFDNDPEAVRVSAENAVTNGLAETVPFSVDDLDSGLGPDCTDLLLANIETPVLREFRPRLLEAVRPGGALVMSGILDKDADALASDFEALLPKFWPESVDVKTEKTVQGEWAGLVLRRKTASSPGA